MHESHKQAKLTYGIISQDSERIERVIIRRKKMRKASGMLVMSHFST